MIAVSPVRDRADPLAVIEEGHGLTLEFCDILEGLADRLPDSADPALASVAVAFLRDRFPAHLRVEEHVLCQLVTRHAARAGHLRPIIERLKVEHCTDACAALEIVDELQVLARHGRVANAEMLGYMLRGFFEAQRRQIWWKNSVLLPLARAALSRKELAELHASIDASEILDRSRHSVANLNSVSNDGVRCDRCAVRIAPVQEGRQPQ
jgi:hemerythrin-like domain-containing protein